MAIALNEADRLAKRAHVLRVEDALALAHDHTAVDTALRLYQQIASLQIELSEATRRLQQVEEAAQLVSNSLGDVVAVKRWASAVDPERYAAQLKETLDAALTASPPRPGGPMTDKPAASPPDPPTRRFVVSICEQCLRLEGEMCHNPSCRFCRRTMAEVGEYLDVLLIRPVINGERIVCDEGEPDV